MLHPMVEAPAAGNCESDVGGMHGARGSWRWSWCKWQGA